MNLLVVESGLDLVQSSPVQLALYYNNLHSIPLNDCRNSGRISDNFKIVDFFFFLGHSVRMYRKIFIVVARQGVSVVFQSSARPNRRIPDARKCHRLGEGRETAINIVGKTAGQRQKKKKKKGC